MPHSPALFHNPKLFAIRGLHTHTETEAPGEDSYLYLPLKSHVCFHRILHEPSQDL